MHGSFRCVKSKRTFQQYIGTTTSPVNKSLAAKDASKILYVTCRRLSSLRIDHMIRRLRTIIVGMAKPLTIAQAVQAGSTE